MPAMPAQTANLDLGGVLLTYVPDGEFRAEPGLAYPQGYEAILADGLEVLDEDGMLVLSVGAILITTRDRRVLVDAGIGKRTIPLVRPGTTRDAFMRGGKLLENLRSLGVEPSDIDAVLLTHLHADHVGWIGNEDADDVPTFPRAEYWLNEAEWDFCSPCRPRPATWHRGSSHERPDLLLALPALQHIRRLPGDRHRRGRSRLRLNLRVLRNPTTFPCTSITRK